MQCVWSDEATMDDLVVIHMRNVLLLNPLGKLRCRYAEVFFSIALPSSITFFMPYVRRTSTSWTFHRIVLRFITRRVSSIGLIVVTNCNCNRTHWNRPIIGRCTHVDVCCMESIWNFHVMKCVWNQFIFTISRLFSLRNHVLPSSRISSIVETTSTTSSSTASTNDVVRLKLQLWLAIKKKLILFRFCAE